MPSLAELMTGAIHQAGSEVGKDPAIQYLAHSKLQKQKSEQDQALKEFLLGKQISEAERLRGQYGPEVGVNVEGVSIQPRDQLRKAQMEALQEERDIRHKEELAKRLGAGQMGETGQALRQLGSSVEKKGFAVTPTAATLGPRLTAGIEEYAPAGLAKLIGVKPGASEQMQAFSQAESGLRHALYAGNLTAGEAKLYKDAYGMYSTGSPEQRIQAMKTFQDIYNNHLSRLGAPYPERIKRSLSGQMQPVDITSGLTKQKDLKDMSDEELKAIAGGR